MIKQAASHSIIGRAQKQEYVTIHTINIRDFAINKHGQVDDAPYGGGPGMIMMAEPIYKAFKSIDKDISHRLNGEISHRLNGELPLIYMSPKGRKFNQAIAQELSQLKEMAILCGHYEGVDERIINSIVTDEISIGDYILTGGELASLVVIDAVSRFIPCVLGNGESVLNESFSCGNILEHPHYTRPAEFMGQKVPDILLSGHHENIRKWREEMSKERI